MAYDNFSYKKIYIIIKSIYFSLSSSSKMCNSRKYYGRELTLVGYFKLTVLVDVVALPNYCDSYYVNIYFSVKKK